MRACVGCLLLLLLAGCGTLGRHSTDASDFTLTKEETDFAHALAYYAHGLILEQEIGRSSAEAMDAFAKAGELDPGRQELVAKAALIALQRKTPESAVAILEKACKANPRSVQAWLDLAAIYQAASLRDKAIESYVRVIKLDETCTFAYLALTRLYFDGNQDDKALAILRKGAKDAQKKPAVLAFCYNKGRDFVTSGEIPRSIPCFQIIAQFSPSQRPQFYTLMGELYESLGYDKEAARLFTQATHEEPPLPDSFVKLALMDLKSNPEKALDTLRRADRLAPDNPGVLFLLGYVYSRQDRNAEAIQVYDRILSLLETSEPESLPASFYLFYGGACERTGQFEKAESIFKKGLLRFPNDDQVLNYLAYMWAERGVQLDEAEHYITRALKLEPNNGAYLDTLGWIYFKQRKYKEALDRIQRAYELIQDDAVVTDHLGDVFNALNDTSKAVSYWRQSFLLAPDNKAVAAKLEARGIRVEDILREGQKVSRPATEGRK